MSNSVSKIKNLTRLVKEVLIKYPDHRDDDRKLVMFIWASEMDGGHSLSFFDFMTIYMQTDELSSYDNITRARRKVQEKHEDLRGIKYYDRKKQAIVTRKNINK